MTELDRDACYRAISTRDARFDGRFFTCVTSTRVFCRPICPARTPKMENCIFVPSAAAAIALGYRPCLRCRPETAPGVAAWRGTANTISRALALIAEGALDDGRVGDLADRLGVGERHLRRLFERHLGASPLAVAHTQRLLFAKRLVTETALPMAEVALAAGFRSVRRFNAVLRATYGRPPGALRRAAAPALPDAAIELRLPFTEPYDWPALLVFLGPRAIPGIERVAPDLYLRAVEVDGVAGLVAVRPAPDGRHLVARIRLAELGGLAAVVARLRRFLDLDTDIAAIDAHLARDPRLAPIVRARPGLRIPGAWDPFELAVRAILGQQVSVTAATTFAGRLVAAHGRPLPLAADGAAGVDRLFPRPEDLAGADLTAIGLTGSRARAISGLAAAMAADPGLVRADGALEATVARLCRLPGIGPWTAHYVAMRALGEPDAFPPGDIGLLRAMDGGAGRPTAAALDAAAEAWRPWRAYACMHLWAHDAAAARPARSAPRRRPDPIASDGVML